MALSVAKPKAQPTLSVAPSLPAPVLKVVRNYNTLGVSTYNPQQTVSPQVTAPSPQQTYNPQSTYNPQAAAQAAAVQQAAIQVAQVQAAAAEKKRLSDVFNNQLQVKTGGWQGVLSKFDFASTRSQKSNRDLALQYATQNGKQWYQEIVNHQTQFEKDLAAKKDWIMQSQSQAEYDSRLASATDWLNKTQNSINADIKDFNDTQKQLYAQANKKMTGFIPNVGRAIGTGIKDIGKVGGAAWNFGVAAINMPNRIINTAMNLNTPDRTIYKDNGKSTTLQGGIKNAWNASQGQRVLNAKPWVDVKQGKQADAILGNQVNQLIAVRKKIGETDPKKLNYNLVMAGMLEAYNWQHRGWNSATQWAGDPTMYVGGGELAQGGKKLLPPLFKGLGKSKLARDAILSFTAATNIARESKAGKAAAWLNKEHLSPTAKWLQDNKDLIIKKRALGDELKSIVQIWRDSKVAATKPFTDKLRQLTPQEADLFYKYVTNKYIAQASHVADATLMKKAAHSWDGITLPRGFGGSSRKKIEDLARNSKQITDQLFGQQKQQLLDIYNGNVPAKAKLFYNRGYVPHYAAKDGGVFKPRPDHWSMPFYNKRKVSFNSQDPQTLANSYEKRITSQMWRQNPEASWLNKYAGKYVKELNKTDQALSDSKAMFDAKKGGYTKQGLSKIYHTPMQVWRMGVLKYRPAWYINNVGWNIPASISAGGAGTVAQYAKILTHAIKERTLSPKILRELPDEVASQIGQLWGFERKANGKLPFATKLENISRSAAYMNLRDRGINKGDSVKRVNSWMFNYSTKNYQRPFKAVLPFLTWQLGLTKLVATMPFKNPRAAKMYFGAYNQFYKKPFDAIPSQNVSYTNEQGQQVSYNTKDKYRGKLKIGNTWINTPFNAMTPEQLGAIGVNPLLSAFSEWATNQDKYGNLNTEQNFWKTLARTMPQYKLTESFINRNKAEVQNWFSASGYSKSAQGTDPTKPNYRANLDNKRSFNKLGLNYLGVPNNVSQDLKAEDKTRRLTSFNTDYFKINWDKRLAQYQAEDPKTAYDRINADKQALAQKYGMNFQKDIAKGSWAKFDTATTTHTKLLKEQAQAFANQYWSEVNGIPKAKFIKTLTGGYYEKSKKDPYWIAKFKEWQVKHTFANNPYYDIPHYNVKDANGKNTGAKDYINPFKLQAKADKVSSKPKFTYKGKFFKSADSMARYKTADQNQFDGKHFKSAATMQAYKDGQFWSKYFALRSFKDKQALLDANPQYRTSKAPTTFAEGMALKAAAKQKQRQKLLLLNGFAARESSWNVTNVPATKVKRAYKKVVFKKYKAVS